MAGNPLSTVTPWDVVSEGYVTETQPIFEKWAKDSFERTTLHQNHSVIDIACGPGTVSLLLADKVKEITSLDFSKNMLSQFQKRVTDQSITNINMMHCDCQTLPLASNLFDRAFSQFGLMFFPDRKAGFAEMYRVLKSGGEALVYSWAPLSESTAMTLMIGALHAGFPETRPKEDEPQGTLVRTLDDASVFTEEMEEAGFTNISIEPIKHSFPVPSVNEFWQSMVRGSAPITMMKARLPKEEWEEKEAVALEFVREHITEGMELYSTALLGVGKKI